MEFPSTTTAVESNKHESKPRCGFEGGFTKVSLPELLNACKLNQKPAKETSMSNVLHAGQDAQHNNTRTHLASRVRAAARSSWPEKAYHMHLRRNR
jgi:hypothetical protein